MSDLKYINTQQIRQDLVGFLQSIAAGQKYVVLNRSKAIVTLRSDAGSETADSTQERMRLFLEAAARARQEADSTLPSDQSYKDAYHEGIAKKYGVS